MPGIGLGDGVEQALAWPRTITWNPLVALLPAASVAVQSTLVVPIANVCREAGVQTTAGFGSRSSVAATT
jgi:hypothetical protein